MIFKNYQSDFEFYQELRNGQNISTAPFELTYYIPGKEQKLIASFDGENYTNCRPEGNGIVVVVDYSQVQLGIGSLRCTSRYYLDNSDYPDGACEPVSDFEVGITLHRGESDEVDSLVAAPLPSYHVIRTGGGGGGGGEIPNGSVTEYKLANGAVSTDKIKDSAVTMAKLSDEVKNKLNQGGGGGMSEIPDGGVTTDKIADAAVTEQKLGNDVSTTLGVMKNKLDILYKVALTFSGGGNKKKGTSVNVTLSWTVKVNGTAVNPSSQTLNGEALDVTLRKKTFTGVTEDTTYTLVVDGVQATQSVKFYNPSYFGVVAPDYQVSSDVSGLTEQTNYGSRSLTKTASASGSMKVVYLYPSALGSLTSIKDGNNFDITGSFTKTTDITINGEEYIAYLLTQEANINGLTFKFA